MFWRNNGLREPLATEISRRCMVAAVAGAPLTACARRHAATPIPRVSIVRATYSQNLFEQVRRLLAEHRLSVQGRRVLLKPNLVEFDSDYVVNTHPLVVHAALEAFRAMGAAEVRIAEGPGHRRGTLDMAEAAGYFRAIPNFETCFTDLNLDEVSEVPLIHPLSSLGSLYLPHTVLGCDLLVSLPKLKTHHWAGATVAMKNLFGVVPGGVYGWPKNILHWAGIHESIADLYRLFPHHFAIVDGIVGMQGNGPIQGEPKALGCLVAGDDMVAVDATCCRLMRIDPARIGYLAASAAAGQTVEQNVEQIGEPIAAVQTTFELLPELTGLRLYRENPPDNYGAGCHSRSGTGRPDRCVRLLRLGQNSVVLEADSHIGGLARTAEYKGYLFDMGGHRFFTKVALVEKMWHEVLGDDFLTRPRLSRIYYRSKFFHYPLQPWNALFGLGVLESVRCALSYGKARLRPQFPEDDFETWVSNRFGRRLFSIFFRAYTEKVWGIPCRQIQAEWAAQRIKGLSLSSVIWNALGGSRGRGGAIKTLIHEFQYPRRGPGMMWTKTCELVRKGGARVLVQAPVEKIVWEPGRIKAVIAAGTVYEGEHFLSSIPIRTLIYCLDPPAPGPVVRAAEDFHYRDFLTVALIVRGAHLFPDNWIYVHDPKVKVGRIQNYANWSPEMVPDPENSCLGLEYFCNEGDNLWSLPDSELLSLGGRELAQLGLVRPDAILDGTVVRVPKAYPVYDDTYQRGLTEVRRFLQTVPNLQLIGRNGMHRYNNQDHSMLTAILAARNALGCRYNLWDVNADAGYHEEGALFTEEDLQALERVSTPACV